MPSQTHKGLCFKGGRVESLNYIFLTTPLAQKLWGKFFQCASFNQSGVVVSSKIQEWWSFHSKLERQKDPKCYSSHLHLGALET